MKKTNLTGTEPVDLGAKVESQLLDSNTSKLNFPKFNFEKNENRTSSDKVQIRRTSS